MPINLSQKTVISKEISSFFEDLPKSEDALQIVIKTLLVAIRDHEANYFRPLAKLFEEPQNFFALHLMGPLTKGEVRVYMINHIDFLLKEAARNAGTTFAKLDDWNTEEFLKMTNEREDQNDNLICQEISPPADVKSDTYLEDFNKDYNAILSNEIINTIVFKKDENTPGEPSCLTLKNLSDISQTLAILEPTYIHSSIDALGFNIPNIFNNNALRLIAEHLPDEYTNLKTYFKELAEKIDDIDVALSFFHTSEKASIALAVSLAIAQLNNLEELKKNVLIVITEVDLKDKVKEAFISHVVMDSKQFMEIQKKADVSKQKNVVSQTFFRENINDAKINSVFKSIKKDPSLSKDPGKMLFEKLTINELEKLLLKVSDEYKNKGLTENIYVKVKTKIQERIDTINGEAKNLNISSQNLS